MIASMSGGFHAANERSSSASLSAGVIRLQVSEVTSAVLRPVSRRGVAGGGPLRVGGGVRAGVRSKAEVGERLLPIPVEHLTRHLAGANMEQVAPPRPHDLRSARLTAPSEPSGDEHALVVKLAILLRLDAELLPGAHVVAPPRFDLGQPPEARGLRATDRHELHIGVS